MKSILKIMSGFCIFGLLLFVNGCDLSAHQEETKELLTAIKEQQTQLEQQIKENTETLKEIEKQNVRLQKLLEYQQRTLARHLQQNKNIPSPDRVAKMIQAMSRRKTPSQIVEILNQRKLPAPDGKESWTEEDIQGILQKK